MTGQSTPPGFYPDPENPGQQRYWDGTQWSATTSAGTPPQPQPQAAYTPQPAGPMVTLDNGTPVTIGEPVNRLVARIIDGVIVGIPFGILYSIFVVGMIGSAEFNPRTGEFEGGAGFVLTFFLSGLILAALYLAYETFMLSNRGATVGKQVMGLKVVSQVDGSNLPPAQALIRTVVLWAPGIIPCVGGIVQILVDLSLFFDNSGRRQGWQDKTVKSLVISTK